MPEAMTTPSKLPIGVESFRELRERGCRYVDKTLEIGQLAERDYHFRLARPRGFGKTLLLSTIECLFRGERELFQGLAVEPHWNWSTKRPVVRLDLGAGDFETEDGLDGCIRAQLMDCGRRAGIDLRSESSKDQFKELLTLLHRQSGKRAAVLVDNFDRPVLDLLGQPKVAERNRRMLTGVLSNLKDQRDHIRFALLAGSSAPALADAFDGVRHLVSLTASSWWPTICGFREQELDAVFAEELAGLDRDRIRERYLGYRWHGDERVYCPWDILHLLKERQYRAWWFEAESPQPTIDLILKRRYPWEDLARAASGWPNLEKFVAVDPSMVTILFQTGFSTRISFAMVDHRIRSEIGYPNAAVRESMSEALLRTLWGDAWRKRDEQQKLRRALEGRGPDGMAALLRDLLARIRSADGERRMHRGICGQGALYAHFAALGERVWIDGPRKQRPWDLCLQAGGRLWAVRLEAVWKARPKESPSAESSVASRYGQRGLRGHFFRITCSLRTDEVIGFESERIPAPAANGRGREKDLSVARRSDGSPV